MRSPEKGNAILEWGTEVVLWFQQFSPQWDGFFRLVTEFGDETFLLVAIPAVYWSVDRLLGIRLAVVLMVSSVVNAVAKELADQPRPFAYDERVARLTEAGPYGLPSGHTQSVVVGWGYLAAVLKRRWVWLVGAVMVVLVPMSRVYLGVHFPTDLLGGALLGLAVLGLFLRYWAGFEDRLSDLGLAARLAAVSVPPAVGLALAPTEIGVTAAAALFGIGTGMVLEREFVRFEADGSKMLRIVRFLAGAVVLVGLFFGMRVAFADLEPALLWRFVRYASAGLWATGGAPWLFVRTGLATGAHT